MKTKKECIAPFKYITISNVRHAVDTLYLESRTCKSFDLEGA